MYRTNHGKHCLKIEIFICAVSHYVIAKHFLLKIYEYIKVKSPFHLSSHGYCCGASVRLCNTGKKTTRTFYLHPKHTFSLRTQ